LSHSLAGGIIKALKSRENGALGWLFGYFKLALKSFFEIEKLAAILNEELRPPKGSPGFSDSRRAKVGLDSFQMFSGFATGLGLFRRRGIVKFKS